MRTSGDPGTRLVLVLRYRDVAAAVDWLCRTLGFEKHDVVTAVDGTILDARLMFGNDMILLVPTRGAEPGLANPRKQGRVGMQSCYLVVDDVDVHYRHAKAAGAEILDINEYDYGGRGYSCRDPEGHIWNFGSYDPWQTQSGVDHQLAHRRTVASGVRLRSAAGFKRLRDNINPPIVIAAVVAAVVAAAAVGWILVGFPERTPRAPESEPFKANASLQRTEEGAEHVDLLK